MLIAGGGPVGLMLALELDYHGIDAVLVERNPTTTQHPKMDITNGRSMELFRRLGVIDALRAAAVPEHHPMSVIWADNLAGWELARFDYPSVQDMRRRLRERNDGTMAAEPAMRISQVTLEPVLKGLLETQSRCVELRFGQALETFTQDADGVTATLRDTASGEVSHVRSAYLAGCDGAGSVTRRTLGIPINTITPFDYVNAGDDHHNYLDTARGEPSADAPKIRGMFMIHWTSPELELFERFGTAWHIQSPLGWSIISQNDKDTWTVHIPLSESPLEGMEDIERQNPKEVLFTVLGCEFECDIQVANPWQPTLGLADSYGTGRVWLAGDAVHQVIPTGGYGMNSGLGDALALGWVLAANAKGWGRPALFNAYEMERRHVGARVRIGSARHAAVRRQISDQYDPLTHEDTPAGTAKRAEVGAFIETTGNLENEAWGLEWGYRYDDSPIICHEAGEPPAYEWEHCEPGTWPGGRAPNVFLADGCPIFDKFGREFTLLAFGEAPCERLQGAAAAAGVPLDVLRIDDSHAAQLYERKLVLVRPDQHVAWRGDEDPTPAEAAAIVDRVRGANGDVQ